MKYFIVAGEASGDLHAAHLMRQLKAQDPEARFAFFGGDLMAAEGGKLISHYREGAFMGFSAVILNLRSIMARMRLCQESITQFTPDVVILVDYPGFNLKIAKWVKRNTSTPVHYYISPKIWAWKEHRIRQIKAYVDVMLSILPFEVAFYQGHHYPITYVGNPSADEVHQYLANATPRETFLAHHSLSDRPIVALLCGSRRSEITMNLPAMLEATDHLAHSHTRIIAAAPGIDRSLYAPIIAEKGIFIVENATYDLLHHAALALVTSGTATLETALLNVPQVVCYRVSHPRLMTFVFRRIFKVGFISLVNLIADHEVVLELTGTDFSTANIRREADRLLSSPDAVDAMRHGYDAMRHAIGTTCAPIEAARTIIAALAPKH